jgi:four helix bundle protein
MHYYDNLQVYICAMDLAEKVLLLSPRIKVKLGYAMVDQIQRAAISIPSNISEGAGRNGNKEFVQFLGVANGSLGELHTQSRLINRLEVIDEVEFDALESKAIRLQRMIRALRHHLESSRKV